MALGSIYKKYGFSNPGPGSLISSQKAASDSLTHAFDGIGALLNDAENRYKETNTLNLQEKLRQQVRAAGLGSEPIDTTAIQREYGSLADMDKVKASMAAEKKQMVSEALDTASISAGQAFASSEDMSTASNVYQQQLRKLNMPESQVNQYTREWQDNNKYLAENVELHNNQLIDAANAEMFTRARNGENAEDVQNDIIKNAPDKLKNKLTLSLRTNYENLSKMTEEQRADYQIQESQIDNKINELTQTIQQDNNIAKATYDAIEVVPQSALNAVTGLQQQFGGVTDAMGKDASNGIVKGTIRYIADKFADTKQLTGYDAALRFQQNTDELISRGVPADMASAIAYQSYNELKAADSTGNVGTVFDAAHIDQTMNRYMGAYENKQKALARYNEVQKAGIQKLASYREAKLDVLNAFRKGERKSNISGRPYDSEAAFRASIFGGGSKKIKTSPNNGKVGKGDNTNKGKSTTKKEKKGTTINDVFNLGGNMPTMDNDAAEAQSPFALSGDGSNTTNDLSNTTFTLNKQEPKWVTRTKQTDKERIVNIYAERLKDKSTKEQEDFITSNKKAGRLSKELEQLLRASLRRNRE